MRSLRILCTLLLLITFGCQNYSENTLGTDKSNFVKCPANGCSNSVANSNEMQLASPNSSVLVSRSFDASVNLGGECFASTFPDNRIEVNVYNANNGLMSVGAFSTSPAGHGIISCVKGRYNIVLDAGAMPVPGNYKVNLVLVGYDAKGQPHRGGLNTINWQVSRIQ